ncbi:SurA N-terminal domain-containing protein [Bacillus sp. SCS-151]|uniref:SurA N-terminal domain-containing protein n=1 Tax=Nanhaiella sioensis TaxID=3115293 RepID=UPI00397BEF0E
MKNIRFIVSLFLSLIIISGCSTNEDTISNNDSIPKTFEVVNNDEIIATVNEEEIKGKELNKLFTLLKFDVKEPEEVSNAEKKYVANILIKNKYILQKAEKKDYQISSSEIEENLIELKSNYNTEEDFVNSLKDLNMTVQDVEEQIKESLLYEKYVNQEIKIEEVDESDLKEEYSIMERMSKEREIPSFNELRDFIKEELEEKLRDDEINKIIDKLIEEEKIVIFL